MNAKEIIYKIRKIREEKNLTQEYIARELDISTKAYSNIENGVSHLNIERLLKIAEILELPAAEFFGSNQHFNFENCKSSGYLNQPTFHNENEYLEAKQAWQQLIAQQQEEIAFLKRLLER